MDCYDVGRGFTDHASTDVLSDGVFSNGHHWYRCVRRKPVGLVVAAGVIAHAVEVAKQERHGAKSPEAGAGITEILIVGLFVAFDVEERVTVPELGHAIEAGRHCRRLAVADQQDSHEVVAARQSWQTRIAWLALCSRETR